ncbi:MAG: YhcH/YjgK/YiaL family protein [Chloroflexi bacterium]|nr:YhcH/YjgK/YiaL family protein [Chloroflexota bacterium]
MIVSDLAHLPAQLRTNSAFDQAIEFLRREGWRGHADGIVPIDGETVYGMLQSYETKIPQDTVPFEGHRKYIDIQYVIEGKETIYWTPTGALTPTTPYDDGRDIWFSQFTRQDAIPVALVAGQLAVLFPEDAHAPTHVSGASMRVRKIVVKVAVSS